MKKLLPLSLSLLICMSIAFSYAHARTGQESKEEPGAPEAVVSEDEAPNIPALFFMHIPDPDLDILTQYMRWEMVLYAEESDSTLQEENVYGGISRIEEMTPDYLSVHLTDVSNIALKSLNSGKYKDTHLVMSIYTISGDSDTADSTLKFYTLADADSTAIKSLPAKQFINLPNPSDFYRIEKGSGISKKQLESALPFHTVAYSISADGDTLIGRPTIANYLTREERERLEPYLVKELRWKWNGKKFDLIPQPPTPKL